MFWVRLLLPWASIICLLLSAWFWWKASARIDIPATLGFVQSPMGEGGPIKALDAVLVRLQKQSKLNAIGARWAVAAVILLAIEKAIEQWD